MDGQTIARILAAYANQPPAPPGAREEWQSQGGQQVFSPDIPGEIVPPSQIPNPSGLPRQDNGLVWGHIRPQIDYGLAPPWKI